MEEIIKTIDDGIERGIKKAKSKQLIQEIYNRMDEARRMFHNSTEWECEEHYDNNGLTYDDWIYEAVKEAQDSLDFL